jgi:hypothetical protein
MALEEVVALNRFKQLMAKYGGKQKFKAYGKCGIGSNQARSCTGCAKTRDFHREN